VLLERELGMLVQLLAQRDELRGEAIDGLREALVKIHG
jgi:hypothetical protein